jgi:hypothetical protein
MNPNEIFGHPSDATSLPKENFEKYYCRFLNSRCDKQSRMIDYPMGICSVNHSVNKINEKAIICPHRFLEDSIVFNDIAQNAFGSTDNVLLFSEIRLNNVGSFDFVLVKHKPLSCKVVDFCVVEFQSDSTTGTGKLVDAIRDFTAGRNVLDENYSFGLNTYNTIKLSYIQMLIKGQVMERWNKYIYWVMQKYVFENMENRFKLNEMEYDENLCTKYFLYDLINNGNLYNIQLVEKRASSISNLLKAFTHQPTPSLDEFINVLEDKINLKLGLFIV